MRITFASQDEAIEFINKLQPHLSSIAGVSQEFVIDIPEASKEAAEQVAAENNAQLLTFNIIFGILQRGTTRL